MTSRQFCQETVPRDGRVQLSVGKRFFSMANYTEHHPHHIKASFLCRTPHRKSVGLTARR